MRKVIRKLIFIIKLINKGRFLHETGWLRSVECRMPVNKNGEEIPWFTYSFIYFLHEKINKNMSIFEYGSGNSTIYFSSRVTKICSLEHDEGWYQKMKDKLPKNVEYHFKPLYDCYADFIKCTNKRYDIIIIDGRERVACAKNAPEYLKDDGVIILDNSLREKYKVGLEYLSDLGFKRIDFRGLNPAGFVLTVTSIFYKKNNCFNL